MQTVSALYNEIMAGEHWFEDKLVIAGSIEIPHSQIFELSTSLQMFDKNPTVGKAVAGEINVRIYKPTQTIPRMAELRPYVRVCNATQQSEWLAQGVFFIDTREENRDNSGLTILTLHGYDAMMKAEQAYASTGLDWPAADTDIVDEIAGFMGVDVDQRTYDIMTGGYTLPLPSSYSLREVLGFIASAYVGSFVITDKGKLRLVSLVLLPLGITLLSNQAEATRYLSVVLLPLGITLLSNIGYCAFIHCIVLLPLGITLLSNSSSVSMQRALVLLPLGITLLSNAEGRICDI